MQYRDLLVAKGNYVMGQKENVVPGSDLAGEIIALGTGVSGWAVGDRVCSNFAVDHIFGETSAQIRKTCLGAPIDGVLTEYKVLPTHVSSWLVEHKSGAC